MPKFQIQPVGSTAPANVLPFQSSQVQDGSAQIGKSLSDFGNLIGQIADKSILAEQSQIVNNANTITQLDLAALSSDRDIKNMSITGAMAEYKKRSKQIYDNAISTMSPAAKRMFDKSWSANSTRSLIKFQGEAVKRNNAKIEASSIVGENNALVLGKQTGFDPKIMETVIASYQNLVNNGIWGADKAATKTVAFTRRWAKEAVTSWINNGTADTLADQYRILNAGGKELPDLMKSYWNEMDPTDHSAMRDKVLARLNHQLGLERRATAASEKKADNEAEKLFGIMKINIEAAATGDETAITKMQTYTPDYIKNLVKKGMLKGKDGGALQALMSNPDTPKVNVVAVNALVNKVYAIADLEDTDQKAAIKLVKEELNTLISKGQANFGNSTTINSLIDKIQKQEFKETDLYKGRKYLMRVLNVGEKAIISTLADKPGERRKAEEALREFDRRMSVVGDNGLPKADPYLVAEELIRRVNIKPRELKSFVKPRFSPVGLDAVPLENWTTTDLGAAQELLEKKKRDGHITLLEYKHQLKNINLIMQAMPPPDPASNGAASSSALGGR